jgi:hypothetical protein
MKGVFLIHLASTWALVGLIWTIQVLHYPLFKQVGTAAFPAYHTTHNQRITPLVLVLMLAELLTALALVAERPAAMPTWAAWLGMGLVGLIWFSTAFLQVPYHGQLSAGFSEEAHQNLVLSNWLRTLAWTARGGLLMWVLWQWLRVS